MRVANGPKSDSIPSASRRRGRRADATRNQARVLAAARRLVETRGAAGATMDEIAAEAGVGKGTVYRAFGGRGRLAEALVDEAERELQARVLGGPPPLGPGDAAPVARLRAFAEAYLRFLERHGDLLAEVDYHLPGGRFATGAYGFWRVHVANLVEAAGGGRPRLMADFVLALLAADLYVHLRHEVGASAATLRRQAAEAVVNLVECRPASS